MIYLIDEKKLRQENYSWTVDKFREYQDYITPIYTKKELDLVKNNIFSSPGNILLFHDSFFDDPNNRHDKDSDQIRQNIINRSGEITTVFFSGGVYNRTIHNSTYASLPVEWVYKNLEFFIDQLSKGVLQIELLAFGRNHKYERISQLRRKIWESLYIKNDNEMVTLFNSDDPNNNQVLNEALTDLANLIDNVNLYNISTYRSIESGYLKHRINSCITEYINE